MFMAEVFDVYVKKRLLDVALDRRMPRRQIHPKMGPVLPDAVKPKGLNMYSVQSSSNPSEL